MSYTIAHRIQPLSLLALMPRYVEAKSAKNTEKHSSCHSTFLFHLFCLPGQQTHTFFVDAFIMLFCSPKWRDKSAYLHARHFLKIDFFFVLNNVTAADAAPHFRMNPFNYIFEGFQSFVRIHCLCCVSLILWI